MQRSATMAAMAALVPAVLSMDPAAWAQWSDARLLNEVALTGTDVKTGGIAPARGGGFHAIYIGNGVRYRRYLTSGALSDPVYVYGGQSFNAKVAESLNGEIHIVFEDWAPGPNNVRWFKSSNGGAGFPVTQVLTSCNCAKHPLISAFGMGTAGDMVMSYYQAGTNCDKSLMSRRYDGLMWLNEAALGSRGYSEYDVFGMARSPLDGSVFRSFDTSGTSMSMRRFSGVWGSEMNLVNGMWPVRQHMAVNAAGQIMIVWDSDSHVWSQLWSASGSPLTSATDLGKGGYSGACDVCAIPGTNDFYRVIGRDLGGGQFHVYGARFSNGWQPEESVMNGLANTFLVTPLVTADAIGNLYCLWEYWGTEKPQQWFAVRPVAPPSGSLGTISGRVMDNRGALLPNVSITVTGVGGVLTSSSGTYSIQVPVGGHTIDAYKVFYGIQTMSGVAVTAGSNAVINFTLTTQPPVQIGTFSVTPANRTNTLSWTNSMSPNYSGVVLRWSLSGPPLSPTDGQPMADITGTPGAVQTFTHAGLTNGTIYYYSAFAYFQDASRYYAGGGITRNGAPFGPGDYDHDGDVDQSDFAHMQACLTGAYNPQSDPACQDARFDADDDVDVDDLALWYECYSGPSVAADPNCAG